MRREEVEGLAERLNALLAGLEEEASPGVTATVAEILEGIQRVHAEGLRRLAELLGEDRDRFRRALDDPVISNLFLLYDLAVVDERGRAEAALASVRPLARAHGGEIELVDVDEGVVSVRLHGACHGCPSSTATLRGGIERALAERLPGFVRLEVAGANGRAGAGSPAGDVSVLSEEALVRLERRLARGRGRGREEPGDAGGSGSGSGGPRPGHGREAADGPGAGGARRVEVASLDDLPRGALYGALVEDFPLLLVALDDGVAAYRNACPGSPLPLHLGRLEHGAIVCPWHGCRFDARSGARRAGEEGAPLERLPVGVERGRVRVELP